MQVSYVVGNGMLRILISILCRRLGLSVVMGMDGMAEGLEIPL